MEKSCRKCALKPHHRPILFICPSECGKYGKEGKKLQKFKYLENKKSFLGKIKKFSYFLKDYHLVKK